MGVTTKISVFLLDRVKLDKKWNQEREVALGSVSWVARFQRRVVKILKKLRLGFELNRRIRNGGENCRVFLSCKIIDKNSISSSVDNSTCQKYQRNCQWNFIFIFFCLKLLMKTLLAQLSSVNNDKIFFNNNSVVSLFFIIFQW